MPTVAVVDDDEGLRYARNLLVSLNLAVRLRLSAGVPRVAGLGAAACLITDVQMPGMSGLELQRRLIDSGDRLPIIFITGFPGAGPPARILDKTCYSPFRTHALRGRGSKLCLSQTEKLMLASWPPSWPPWITASASCCPPMLCAAPATKPMMRF